MLFASWTQLFNGLIVGVLFGFLLRKAQVTRFPVIVRQFLLKDFTVMKVIFTAIAFGGLGIYLIIHYISGLTLIMNSTTIVTAFLGGGIFGIGMAIMGYCPGTGIAALADGSRDMWFGLIGMIFGAGIYAEAFPFISRNLNPQNLIEKTTLAEYFGVSHWFIIFTLFVMLTGLYLITKRYQKRKAIQV